MKKAAIHLLWCFLVLSLINCSTSQPINEEHNTGEIKQKKVDGNIIYYYETPNKNLKAPERELVRNKNEIDFGNHGRKIVKRNWRALFRNGNETPMKGKIALKLCVNQDGDVIYAEILPEETTISDSKTLKQALIASKGYKVQADQNAAPEECGKLIFNLDANN